MANSEQAKKRIRQTERKTAHNRTLKSRMRSALKDVDAAIANGADTAASFRKATSELSKAGRKRLIHPNAAARKQSRLAKRMAKAAAK